MCIQTLLFLITEGNTNINLSPHALIVRGASYDYTKEISFISNWISIECYQNVKKTLSNTNCKANLQII
jgi:hypothetical protein